MDLISFEGYVVDRSRWTLQRQGEAIPLSRKTFDLLLHLIDHRDQVQSKDAILQALWPKQIVEESNLTQQIFLLRKAVSRHESGRKIIDTVAGRGYRFVATLETPPSGANTAATAPEVPRTPRQHSRSPKPRMRLGLIEVLFASAVAGMLGWWYWQYRGDATPVEVVLAELGETGDPILDRALNDALRIDLKQSPLVTVLSPSQVQATLAAMRQPPDARLTPTLAREVCERNSAQVLLQGTVSRFGQKYLVGLRASNCRVEPGNPLDAPGGELLAEAKDQVDRLDDLPQALAGLAAKIRRRLGESRASIRRFDQPLFAAATGSLAALKAYSQGLRAAYQGNMRDSLVLMQRAVDLDPEFGLAYFDIAALHSIYHDTAREREALIKAYALRNTVPEATRLAIVAFYDDLIMGDVAKSLETYKTLVNLYPNGPMGLGNLAEEYDTIGQAALGLEYARRAVELSDSNATAYLILASGQLHSDQPAAARTTCELAIARHIDAVGIRHLLLQAMAVQHDELGIATQIAWGRTQDDGLPLLMDEVLLALSRGEVRKAEQLLDRLNKRERAQEFAAQYQSFVLQVGRNLAEEGLQADSLRLLVPPEAAAQDKNALVALAEDGEVDRADAGLRHQLQEHGTETLWKDERAPEVRAAIFLARSDAAHAVDALDAALPYDSLAHGAPYLRGLAYKELGESDSALAEFQKIIQHPSADPLSAEYPLAILETARAYVRKDDLPAARARYAQFLDLWKTADPELPLLQAARQESTRLAITAKFAQPH